jgi:beta-lactamase regulating signal transducer with metallopeptidase domain
MSELSQLLLTFLLNACWQIALVAMAAALCGWLLRGTAARYRHLLWVIALVSSFCLPLLASSRLLEGESSDQARAQVTAQRANAGSFSPAQLIPEEIQAARPAPLQQPNSFVPVSRNMAALVVVFYLLLLGYRGGKLFLAWRRTKAIVSSAYPVDLPARVQTVIGECQAALGISRAQIMCSTSVPAPITVGIRDPLVILPEQLLQEADHDVLTSAIGHELVHVLRRDYLLNLLYELIALPLAFHPATALLKRRIRETRELGCDELVTDRLLEPAAYARSLVQLAGAAIAVGRPTATITVGIGDADILEERVMAILSRPKISLRRKNLLLASAALVFIVSCVVAAPFARRININSQEQKAMNKDEPTREESFRKMLELELMKQDAEMKLKYIREVSGATLTQEQEAQLKEELTRSAREIEEGLKRGYKGWPQSETQGQEFDAKLLAQQLGIKAGREDELAKLPQITMQQAIQIATSQQPGKVLECRLAGRVVEDLWLAYYDVWILSAEGAERSFTRFAISAIDGRILGRINTSPY